MTTPIGSSSTLAVPASPANVVDYGTASTLSRIYKNTDPANGLLIGLGTATVDATIPVAAGQSLTIDDYSGPVVLTGATAPLAVAKGSVG